MQYELFERTSEHYTTKFGDDGRRLEIAEEFIIELVGLGVLIEVDDGYLKIKRPDFLFTQARPTRTMASTRRHEKESPK
jgi:hypothetical protein